MAAGLSALFAAAHWLTLMQLPGPLQGQAVVGIGSLGLVVSQGLVASPRRRAWPGLPDRARTRLVGEGLSVTWMLAGLVMVDGPPPYHYRALELTVMGVAAGITGYLSADRRRAGWVSGLLLTIASWIRLADNDIQGVEWYTLPAATAFLVYGTRRLRRRSTGRQCRRCRAGAASRRDWHWLWVRRCGSPSASPSPGAGCWWASDR